MAKSSNETIQNDKEKILNELKRDGRQSPNKIAEKFGFSRQKAWKYIKELEREGKIWGYTIATSPMDEKNMLFFALIKQKIPYLENVEKIIRNIMKGNSAKLGINLIGLYYANGPYDCICIFESSSIKDAKKYLGYIMSEYKELVENIDLVENVFPMVHFTKVNPKLEELKDFSIDVR